jgi:hypothetical protein
MARIALLFAAPLLAISVAVGQYLPAVAAPASDTDRAAIQTMIGNQIEAFRHDDGRVAYSFASPVIQSIFPSPDAFMAMVTHGYPMVYRPQSVTFGPLLDTSLGPVQKAFITGPDGQAYVALYPMQRQPDGTWKINGCTIEKDDSPAI